MNIGRYIRGEDRHVGTSRTIKANEMNNTCNECETASYCFGHGCISRGEDGHTEIPPSVATEVGGLCDECETVSHCLKNGCIPKQPTNIRGIPLKVDAEVLQNGSTEVTGSVGKDRRKPLTDDEIWKNDEIMVATIAYGATFEHLREVIRATERAHGIEEK